MKSKTKKAATKTLNKSTDDKKDESTDILVKSTDSVEPLTSDSNQVDVEKPKEKKNKKSKQNKKKETSPPPDDETEEAPTVVVQPPQEDLINQRKPRGKKSKTVKLAKQALLDLKMEMEERESRRANTVKPEASFFTKKKIFIIVFFLALFIFRLFKVVFK